MTSQKLNTYKTPSSTPSKINNHRLAFALLMLALLACGQSAFAQNLQPRPVARLLSDPSGNAAYSRPRRVKAEENNAVAPAPAPSAATSPSLDEANAIERHAFEQTNQARVENGLAPLAWDSELCRMARAHSERMALQGFFGHETPDGLQLKERAHSSGILHFRAIGENIAYNKGYDDPGGFAVERWMISSGHRANILYNGFQASAIGSYIAADGSVFLTQVFITR
jgi:uncharacterized protein YkwD